MEIIKPHHIPSQTVKRSNLARAYSQAKEMISFLDENNEKGFTGHWKKAVALSHCQVSDHPFKVFVIASELTNPKEITRSNNYKNYYFKDRIIFNAKIIKAPNEIMRTVPKRDLKQKGNSKEYKVIITKENKNISNIISVGDGCMSYPYRSEKKTNRYYTITVRYQVLRSFLGFKWLKTITEELEAFKSHVFQHEIDHSFGIDIVHGNGNKVFTKPYTNIC